MSDSLQRQYRISDGAGPVPEADVRPTAVPRFGARAWLLFKTIQARLRFLVVLAAVGGTIAYWDTLRAYYEKWTRPLMAEESAAHADTEFWCPMHPTVVRDHPDKCPLCGMPLSKRKKGDKVEGEALPPGVVSRVQLTPYRVAAAGIRTEEIRYRPLTRDISAAGFVEFDERRLTRITARAPGKSRLDKLFVNVTGQAVEKGEPLAHLYSPELASTVQNLLDGGRSGNADLQRVARERLRLWGIDDAQIDDILRTGKPITQLTIRAPIGGHVIKKYQVEGDYVEEGARLYDVADLSTVWIEAQFYEDELAFLKEGLPVSATTKAFPNREFAGKVAFVHPHLDAATRTLKVRFDMDNSRHDLRPGMYAAVKLQIPATQLDLLPADAGDEQKQSYMKGLVLAVPERAVIDTGSRKVVYREAEPDVFDGVEVQLAPRSGGYYPVVRGLRAGDRVAAAGSFLIDAETRLTAGAGSTFFGASGGPPSERHSAAGVRPSTSRTADDKIQAGLAKLPLNERRQAEAQGRCPITGDLLGSMGKPVLVMLQGQTAFLCCNGCVDEAKEKPEQTLAKVKKLQTDPKATLPKN
jgi:multidrug efflux pump subunit AcrA (membrane-fusion protein)